MTKTWRTADGKEMSIADMTSKHLQNAIKYMERMREQEIASMHCLVDLADASGDMGESLQNSQKIYEDNINDHFNAIIAVLEQELKRRES